MTPTRRRVLAALGVGGALAGAGCQSLPSLASANGCPPRHDPRWSIDGEHWSPPATRGRRTVVSEGYTATGTGPYRIASIRNHDGQEQWVYNVENAGAGVPAIADDEVYVGTGEDRVLAFAAETGHVRWVYDAGGNEEYGGGAWGRPAVADERVVVGVSHSEQSDPDPTDPANYRHRVVALDRRDGTERWAVAVDRTVRVGPALVGDLAVAATEGGAVHGLELDGGRRRWSRSVGEHVYHRPVAGDGVVYVAGTGGGDGDGESGNESGGSLAAVDVASGESRWSVPLAGHPTAVAGDDASLLVGTDDGTVAAHARGDGRERWRYDARAAVAAVASNGGQAWAYDQCGYVHRLDATTGEREYRFRVGDCAGGSECRGPPTPANGMVVDGDEAYLTGGAVGRFPLYGE